jgi:hypothetical protein
MKLTDDIFGYFTVDDFPIPSREICLWLQERYEDNALYMYLVTAWAILCGYTNIKMYYAHDHVDMAKRNDIQLPDDLHISISLYNPLSAHWIYRFSFSDKPLDFIIEPTGFRNMPCIMEIVDKLDRVDDWN